MQKVEQQYPVVLSFCSDIELDDNFFIMVLYIYMFFPISSYIFQLSLNTEENVKQQAVAAQRLGMRLLTVEVSFPS